MSEEKHLQEPAPPTAEQIAEHEAAMKEQKKQLIAFYKAELPLLRLQAEYEETLSKIEIAKMQRLEIMMTKAQMMQDQNESKEQEMYTANTEYAKPPREEPESDAPGVVKEQALRKLKTEK